MSDMTQHVQDLGDGTIEYCDVGTGRPILYFHGTGAGNDAALLLESRLIESGCRLIVPNRPGYFNTSLGMSGSADYCARLSCQLLDRLGAQKLAVIGTSGGGMPAAAFARLYPERTAALILQCAQSHRWDAPHWLPCGIGRALFLFRHSLFIPVLTAYNRHVARAARANPSLLLRSMGGAAAERLADCAEVLQAMESLADMAVRCARVPRGIENDWRILVGDNGIAPNTISCPTLIIHDPQDPLVPFGHAEWSKQSIAEAELLQVHGCGHLIWYGDGAAVMHARRMAFLEAVYGL